MLTKWLDEFDLSEIEIQHVQGIRKGLELVDKDNIVIFALMRAGLYAAEGIRSVFTESQFVLLEKTGFNQIELQDKTIIIVDAVINTGKSIVRVIESLQRNTPKKIIVGTLIMQEDALILTDKYKSISFYASRVSGNKYVGKGGTDTGNRLFNTL